MGFRDFIQRLGEKKRMKKEHFREMEEELRMQKMLEDRTKSCDERELEKFQHKEREEKIKQALKYYREKEAEDIRFNHNPLNIPNITNHTDWEVLKERNMFKQNKCMFTNQPSVLKSNKNLLKNNKRLFRI